MRTRLRLILLGVPVFLVLVVASSVDTAQGQPTEFDDTSFPMTLDELENEIQRREEDLRRYGNRLERLESKNQEVRRELEHREAELRQREYQVRQGPAMPLCMQ